MGKPFEIKTTGKRQSTQVALNESVDGLTAVAACGAVQHRGGPSVLSGVAHVSADGLTLGVRLYDLTAGDWAGDELQCTDTEPTAFSVALSLPPAPHLYRLHLSLTGGAETSDELGFVGSAQLS